ncbi:MAG: TrkH family potassium uptake protein [Methanomassiliicoccales archaeon]|nr:TrkH family potassium uptake protein [Methanomassiliicoccales archaeon]
MKSKLVLHNLGVLAIILGVLMLIPALVSVLYREPSGFVAFSLTYLVAVALGLVIRRFGIREEMGHKEAVATVALAWILAASLGALPYVLLGLPPVDALFESMSGFTTAGATILTDFNTQGYWVLGDEQLGSSLARTFVDNHTGLSTLAHASEETIYGLLFWRSFTQFLGGMGIILLFIAILPHLGVAGRELYSVEGLGLTKEALTPRVKNTAKIFWSIYLALVGLQALILVALDLPLYDAVCTAFTSLATGGFSPRADSIAAYNSSLVDAVVCIFLLIGGTSFLLHYRILFRKEFSSPLRDTELKFYIFIIIVSTSILMLWGGIDGDVSTRFRFSVFQAASIMTTTGYVNNLSYDSWSLASKLALIMLMLIGGSTGSTGGGIKVGRILIILKHVHKELLRVLHPHAVTTVNVGETIVPEHILRSVQVYTLLYLMIFIGGTLVFAITEAGNSSFDAISAVSASACTLGVIGPGYGVVAIDFGQISLAGRGFGTFLMYVGRLEIITVLVLLVPDLWKR